LFFAVGTTIGANDFTTASSKLMMLTTIFLLTDSPALFRFEETVKAKATPAPHWIQKRRKVQSIFTEMGLGLVSEFLAKS
jgi:hypothetical protein